LSRLRVLASAAGGCPAVGLKDGRGLRLQFLRPAPATGGLGAVLGPRAHRI